MGEVILRRPQVCRHDWEGTSLEDEAVYREEHLLPNAVAKQTPCRGRSLRASLHPSYIALLYPFYLRLDLSMGYPDGTTAMYMAALNDDVDGIRLL